MSPISNASKLADFGSGIGTAGAVLQVDNINKRIGIGTTNPQATLQVGTGVSVYGDAGIVSATTFYGDGSNLDNVTSTTINNNADNRLITGSGTANTLNGESTLTFDGVNFGVGSGITMSVTAGVITATSFSGDGSALVGLANTDFVVSVATTTGNLNVSAAATITGALTGSTGTFSGAVNVDATTDSTSSTSGALIVDGGLGVAKNVYIGAGLSVAGTLTYEDVTNVDSVGLITAKSGVNVTGGELKVGTGITIGIAGVATFADGSNVTNGLHFGSGADLRIYADGSNSRIDHNGDGNLRIFSGGAESIKCVEGANVSLFHNGTEMCYTHASGLKLNDSKKLLFGTGSDFELYHDGTSSYIKNTTNDLVIWDDSRVRVRTPSLMVNNAADDENLLVATADGSVDLYYNNSKKFETTNDGTVTTGICTATSFSGSGANLTNLPSAGLNTSISTAVGIVSTLALADAQDHQVTVSGITTFTCNGGTQGDTHTLRLINSGVSTVGFSTYFLFPSGSAPSIPTASGTISLISFTVHRQGSAGIATQLLAGASLNFS